MTARDRQATDLLDASASVNKSIAPRESRVESTRSRDCETVGRFARKSDILLETRDDSDDRSFDRATRERRGSGGGPGWDSGDRFEAIETSSRNVENRGDAASDNRSRRSNRRDARSRNDGARVATESRLHTFCRRVIASERTSVTSAQRSGNNASGNIVNGAERSGAWT